MADKTATYAARQYPLVAVVDFDYSTFTEDQVDQVIALPADTLILSVLLQVRTAWDNSAAVLSVGTFSHSESDPDNFLDAVSLVTGDTTFIASLRSSDDEANLDNNDDNYLTEADEIALLYAAASGTATAGAATLIVEYVVLDRSNENQG